MLRRLPWIVGFGVLLGAGRPAPKYPKLASMMDANKVYRAHRLVINLVTEKPDDTDIQAMYGAVLSMGGQYADAVSAFDLAVGSDWYERRGIPYHASALAAVGRSVEAEALRDEYAFARMKRNDASLNLGAEVVKDHLAGGRSDLAVERARALTLQFPSSPRTFGSLAAALVANGEIDEAAWCLQRAELLGNTEIFPIDMARMEWMIAVGDYRGAWDIHVDYYRKRRFDPRLWRQRLELLRLMGDPEECLMVARQARFAWALDPQFELEASRCASDAGEQEEAKDRVQALFPAYSAHPDVRARAEELGIADLL